MTRSPRHATDDAHRRPTAAVRTLLAAQLRTPHPGRHLGAHSRWWAHTTPRRATLAALATVLALALLAPLLLLTTLTPGSPATLKQDPAVRDLLAYTASLDGHTTPPTTITLTTLANGATKASAVGHDGHCYYVIVPANDTPPSGVRTGTPADCPHP